MLDCTRQMERIIYRAPVVDKGQFPPICPQEEALMEMESSAYVDNLQKICFSYVREQGANWFVDVYFYSRKIKGGINCSRFIIAPGFEMTEEEEREFEFLTDDFLMHYDGRTCGFVVDEMRRMAPELHLESYENFGEVLRHIYYTSFRSGIREILYKAGGLDMLGMYLDKLEEWDLMASNVEEAFGIPYKMLKKLNSWEGIELFLCTKELRDQIGKVYKAYHSILNDLAEVNRFQIQYLMQCVSQEVPKPDKRLLRILGDLSTFPSEEDEPVGQDIFAQYMEYRELLEGNKKYASVFPPYPSLTDVVRFYELSCTLQIYIEHEEEIDKGIANHASVWGKKYIFEDDRYLIRVPRTVRDILQEGEHQHNCLMDYLFPVALGRKTVLFMRDKEKPNSPLVTIEVSASQCITQARQSCNREITAEQMDFLLRFGKSAGLDISIPLTAMGALRETDGVDGIRILPDDFDEEELPFA